MADLEVPKEESTVPAWTVDSTSTHFGMGEQYGQKVSLVAPILSGFVLLIGVAFLLAGLGVGRSITEMEWEGGEVLCVMGLVMSSVSLMALISGIRNWAKRRTSRDPALPFWKRDYPWDPTGCDDQKRRDFGAGIGCGSFALLVATVAVVLAIRAPKGGVGLCLLAGLCLLIGLFYLSWGVWVWRTNLRFGTSRLVYARCPFELGTSLEAEWLGGELLRGASRLEVTIRCVEEIAMGDPHNGGEDGTRRQQLFLLKRAFEVDEQMRLNGRLPLSVGLPPDVRLSTHLSARSENKSARYWIVRIKDPEHKFGLETEFLVPVY